jgi:hypothetical protein
LEPAKDAVQYYYWTLFRAYHGATTFWCSVILAGFAAIAVYIFAALRKKKLT